MDKYDDVVKSLQKRSQQVLPLKYRRETPLKPIPVEALCDYENDKVRRCLCLDARRARKVLIVEWELEEEDELEWVGFLEGDVGVQAL